ncbi:STAS domain-containing protein [Kineococcus aurantiacus]|uniref:Anti-anti-sigma regulatory factor n=1 Tax=Kineococcus aurantiacus TaxID=37633 RepID=A0A7Y9AUZ5_9ACTN|nr:STAS domain-containing protein [Kineococcus aurantiacus]NYD20835.1 anti-anti-sigma regulatory factor [Kineococcus aurantiacus]
MTQSQRPVPTPVLTHLVTHLVTRVPATAGGAGPRGAELPAALTPAPARAGADALPAVPPVAARTDGERLDVVLAGDVDLVPAGDLALVLGRVEGHVGGGSRARVHVDVRAVTALDAVGLRFVEAVRRTCAEHGAACTTSRARPAVERVLQLVRPVVDGQLAAS